MTLLKASQQVYDVLSVTRCPAVQLVIAMIPVESEAYQ